MYTLRKKLSHTAYWNTLNDKIITEFQSSTVDLVKLKAWRRQLKGQITSLVELYDCLLDETEK